MSENYSSRIEKREQTKEKKKGSSDNTGGKKPPKSLWKKILLICLTVGCVLFLAAVGAFWWIIRDVPELDETLLKSPESSQLIASDGETVIAEIGTERRYNVTLDQIPQTLIDAVLATEDVNFYDHFGIDIKRTINAVFSNVFGSSGITQGGSTITQQVVKNAFLTTEQTVTRKVQEWYLAIQLERRFTKDEILEMYFNRNLYGGNIYGVAKAAERFFGIGADELDQLTLEQAALLAGVPQSPNRFNPTVEDNLERAENRRNTVLALMNRHGFLNEDSMTEAQSVPIEDTLNIQRAPNGQFQAFVDVAVTEAQEKTDANIFEDGLRIITTLDPEIQQITEDVISTNDYINFPDNENLETGVVILDTQTGAIKAIGGGRDYQAGGFNYATMIARQPGSTAKPLLSYGPVINNLKWSTGHLITDEEFRYSSGQIVGNQTTNRYVGEQTMRYHLTWSTNVPAIKTNQAAGIEYAVEFARSLGLPIADDAAANESNPLGTMSTASPLIMAGAYAAFGNGGYYIEPFTVSKIIYSDGTENDLTPEKKQVMEDYTAYMVTDMLRDVITTGTGRRISLPSGIDVAGKTGTTSFDERAIAQRGLPSNAVRDAWFVGYTPQYTASVWTGYSRENTANDFLTTEQSRFSQFIFQEIMSRVATSTEKFERPSSVGESNGELFVIGGEQVPASSLDAVTNLTASYDSNTDSIPISWSHSSGDNTDVSFRVTFTVNGGSSQTLTTTSEMSAAIQNPEAGSTYTISVVAVSGGTISDSASISVTPPGGATEEEDTTVEEETPAEEETPTDEETPVEDETSTDEETPTDDGNTADDGGTTDEGNTTDESDTTGSGDNTGGDNTGDDNTGGDHTGDDHNTGDENAAGDGTNVEPYSNSDNEDSSNRATPSSEDATSYSFQNNLFAQVIQGTAKNVGTIVPTFFAVLTYFYFLSLET